jgi:hypothetical protein
MGKKAKLKALKRLGNNQPWINEETSELEHLKGSEILSWGTVTEIDGKPIEPEKMYWFRKPVFIVQNKQRRMKRAYLKHGVEGVKNLIQKNLNTMKKATLFILLSILLLTAHAQVNNQLKIS